MNQCLHMFEPESFKRSTRKLSEKMFCLFAATSCHLPPSNSIFWDTKVHFWSVLGDTRSWFHSININFQTSLKFTNVFTHRRAQKKLVHLTIAQHNLSVNLILEPYGKFQTNMCRPCATDEKRFHTQLITWTIKLEWRCQMESSNCKISCFLGEIGNNF